MSSSPATAPASSDARGSFLFILREFWRGLATPDFRCVLLALGMIGTGLIAATWLAREERVSRDESGAWMESAASDYSRASMIAMQGVARHAPGPEPTLLFVGTSALRFWLPVAADAEVVASEAAGRPIRVLMMCGNAQSYAVSAALLERGGTDFDGFVVIGAGRHMLGREFTGNDLKPRVRQSRQFGFRSPRLRAEAEFLGYRQPFETGWELWDHFGFYYHTRLGLAPWLPGPLRPSYAAYWTASHPVDLVGARKDIPTFSPEMLERHLAVLGRIVADARRAGRARVVLVETPWTDRFAPVLQDAAWHRDEEAYSTRMAEWSREAGVPWLDFANRFPATLEDYVDPRHLGSAALRRDFVATLIRELRLDNAHE